MLRILATAVSTAMLPTVSPATAASFFRTNSLCNMRPDERISACISLSRCAPQSDLVAEAVGRAGKIGELSRSDWDPFLDAVSEIGDGARVVAMEYCMQV